MAFGLLIIYYLLLKNEKIPNLLPKLFQILFIMEVNKIQRNIKVIKIKEHVKDFLPSNSIKNIYFYSLLFYYHKMTILLLTMIIFYTNYNINIYIT